MQQSIISICSNTRICETLFQLEFQLDASSTQPEPGQFLTARVSDTVSPLLRRPFAYSSYNAATNQASIIYQVRGPGTTLLSSFGAGAELDIIGPLGNTFPLPPEGKKALLVAGGIGLGPILFLAAALKDRGFDFSLVFGCKNISFLPAKILETYAATICSDDGTCGFHGSVIDYLVTSPPTPDTVLYCCGPHPMLHACHNFSCIHSIPSYVSVEQTMACGVGACMGCAVKIHGATPYARACKEGPIFNSKDIVWEQ